MSRPLYQTAGLILGSKNLGEASRLIYLLTPDLGLVAAAAQGVRNLSSKLRGHLLDFSWGKFVLVRGRDQWRLTNADTDGLAATLFQNQGQKEVFVRICRLLFRLIRGEGSQRPLFADLRNSFIFLSRISVDEEALFQCELLLLLRLMRHLGYLGSRQEFNRFLAPGFVWRPESLIYPAATRTLMLKAVNFALHHSQL